MGRIKFRWFYTELVEHYFRMAVRYERVSRASSQHWFQLTKNWIDQLSKEDKEFIRFVFAYEFYNTTEGLYCYQSTDDMYIKRMHLAAIEKQFALDSGLIAENSYEDSTGDYALSK